MPISAADDLSLALCEHLVLHSMLRMVEGCALGTRVRYLLHQVFSAALLQDLTCTYAH
jgi:hypothetical protein